VGPRIIAARNTTNTWRVIGTWVIGIGMLTIEDIDSIEAKSAEMARALVFG